MIGMADIMRHHRSLIWNADSGLLLWEVARKEPEGVTCGVCKTEKGKQILEQYGRTLGNLDRPVLQVRGESLSTEFLTPKDFYNIIIKFQYNGAVCGKTDQGQEEYYGHYKFGGDSAGAF